MTERCPSSLDLAAFIDGMVDPALAQEIKEHLVHCEDCQEVVSETLFFQGEAGPIAEAGRPSGKRPWLAAGIGLAAGVLVALSLVWFFAERATSAESLQAAADQRVTLARLSTLEYRPFDPTRGPADRDTNWELVGEAARAAERAENDPTAESLHVAGVASLLSQAPETAAGLLRKAIDREGASWRARNDLGVALLEWGLSEESPARIAEGVEILSEALESDPERAEIAFNRALGLELLGMLPQAIEAWEAYLDLDATSGWAGEARERLARLEQAATTETSSSEIEREVLEELLAAWGAHTIQGREAAARRALAEATELAAQHLETHHDPILRAIVAAAAKAPAKTIARAHAAYARSRQSHRDQKAEECLAATADLLPSVPGDSPLASLAHLTAASCHFIAGQLEASRQAATLARRREASAPQASSLVLGQVAWIEGLLFHSERHPLEALAAYEEALGHFRQAGDPHRAAAVHALRASLDLHLGRQDEAWVEASRAATLPQDDAIRRYQAYSMLGKVSLRQGLGRLAMLAADAALAEARDLDLPVFLSDGSLVRGMTAAHAGADEEARQAFEEALTLADRVADPEVRERSATHARVELAGLLLASDPDAAESLLAASEETGERSGDLGLRIGHLRARVLRNRGDAAAALDSLRSTVERSTEEATTLESLAMRDGLVDVRRDLYSDYLRALLDDGRVAEALVALDSWRSEPFGIPRDSLLSEATLAQPPDATFLVLHSLPDELVVWQWANGEVLVRRVPVSLREIRALAEGFAADLDTSPGTRRKPLRRLGQILFDGLEVAPSTLLVISPDEVLADLPFAAIPLGGDARHLIEAQRVEVAPSVATWLNRAELPRRAVDCPMVVLGATDGGRVFPHLRRLQRTGEEANSILALHGCGETVDSLVGIDAALSAGPSVIQFIGHAVAAPGLAGALLLASSGRLELVDLEALERWPVEGATVILTACSTASGRPSTTVGRDGPARALLSAGAKSVVANLWPIADTSALDFSERFHRHLRGGETTTEALRQAQLEMIAEGRPLSAWAGWRVVGAG